MHTLFALITLALAAAAFAFEGFGCLRTGDLRTALRRRFQEERALFSEKGWPARQRLAQPLFLLALFVLLFGRIFLHASSLYTVMPAWVYDSMHLLYPITYTLLLIKFFFCTRYDLGQMLISLGAFLLVLGVFSRAYDEDYFAFMGFALCAKNIDWRKALAWFAGICLAFTAILALCAISGMLPMWYLRERLPRLEAGYENPNHLSRVLLGAATAILLLVPAAKRRLAAVWLLLPLLLFISHFPRTRSVCLTLIAMIAVCLLFPWLCRLLRLRPVRTLLCASPFIAALCSYAAARCYTPESGALWQKIALFSNGRLKYWSMAAHSYTPHLLGQEIHYSLDGLVALDNSYLLLLYTGGILLFLAVLALCSALIYRLLAARRYWLALIWLCWMIYGAFESFLLFPQSNFMVLLFAPLLFKTAFPADGTPDASS